MTNTFLNRVSAERRVLSVVNGKFSGAYQLTGLSMAAISKWRSIVGLNRTVSINLILLSLAEKCQRLSDRSNETFSSLEQDEYDSLDRQLKELRHELERCL
jgi:hypothetical protein